MMKHLSQSSQKSPPKTVAFYTLGCKTNQLESSALADLFKEKGWQVAAFEDPAALYVINTCTVTERSDHEAKRVIRRARLNNPDGRIAVTGCYAQVAPEELAKLEGVQYVIGNNFKDRLYEIIESTPDPKKPLVQVSDIDKSRIFMGASHAGIDRTRGSLKIQDGCDYKCTYCIIWEARGLSRSLPVEDIRHHLQRMVEEGFREVVLTGINIGQYANDRGQDLADLLADLITVPGHFRLRLTSLDPMEVPDKLIDVVAASAGKIAPHFHLSAQTAEASVLKRMGRRHHVTDMIHVCETIAEKIPNAAIGSDIIVGFPGETEACFEETVRTLTETPMHYFHVFSYSKRKGTPASRFEGQILESVKKERANRLKALSAEKHLAFRRKFTGQTLEVLVESGTSDRGEIGLPLLQKGLSENYLKIALLPPDDHDGILLQPNTFVRAQVIDAEREELLASLVTNMNTIREEKR